MQDKRKAAAIIGMAENFGKEVSGELLAMWLKLLAPYPAAQVEQAILLVIASYEYKTLPPFAVLKAALDRVEGKPEITPDALALAEWGKLLADIKRLGFYAGPPQDMLPATAYALRCMGGWQAACQWDVSALSWKAKEFAEAWKLANGREEIMALGAAAAQEGASGLESSQAILSRLASARQKELA